MAQHKGRSPEGNRIAMGNLRRKVKVMVPAEAPTLPATIPQPNIPLAKPPLRPVDALKSKYLRSVLTREEYDLFIVTWKEWFAGHPEYDLPEDIHDVHTLCMEAVQQYRIKMLEQRYPAREYADNYDRSFRRGQQARVNLSARRVDRLAVGTAKGGTINIGNMNVAVMSGQVNQKKVIELQQRAKDQLADDMSRLDVSDANMDDVIEGEVEGGQVMPLCLPAPAKEQA